MGASEVFGLWFRADEWCRVAWGVFGIYRAGGFIIFLAIRGSCRRGVASNCKFWGVDLFELHHLKLLEVIDHEVCSSSGFWGEPSYGGPERVLRASGL